MQGVIFAGLLVAEPDGKGARISKYTVMEMGSLCHNCEGKKETGSAVWHRVYIPAFMGSLSLSRQIPSSLSPPQVHFYWPLALMTPREKELGRVTHKTLLFHLAAEELEALS